MKKRRAIILAGGRKGRKDFFKDFFLPDDYIICANGGLKMAENLSLKPDLIIGDIDSYDGCLKKYSCEIISFPQEKDKTDTELALEYSKKVTPEEVIILGALGKRLDHSLANIYLVLKGLEAGYPVSLLDEYQEVTLIHKELIIKKATIGEIVSLIPITQAVTGITTTGLRYHLEGDNLYIGQTRGISNEITQIPVSIKINNGLILFIRNFKNLDKR